MNKIVIYSLFLIALFLVAPAVSSFGIKLVPGAFQPSLDDRQKVYKDREISQIIESDQNRLSGIGLSIRNFNLINKKDVRLNLFKDNVLLRTVSVNGGVIRDGQLVKFIFDPIIDSKGQTYKAVFSAEQSTIDEALEVYFTKQLSESSMVGSEVYGQGLSKVLFYRPDSKTSLILEVYSAWLKKLIADTPFFIFYVAVILGLGYLWYKFSKFN